MEGGIAVIAEMTMKRPHRKRTCFLIALIALVIMQAPIIVSLGHAQKAQVTAKEMVVQLYETGGRLTAINLKENWVVIDDHKWKLSEHFDTKGLPPEWKKQGGYECKNGWIVVRYYISLRIRSGEAPLDIGGKPKGESKIRGIMNAEELQELFERGGKIYKIEVMPA